MVSSAGVQGGETGPSWSHNWQVCQTISWDASSYCATTMPSNWMTRRNSVAMARKRSWGSRWAPIACETRISASYRSDSRYSDEANEVATMDPLSPVDARVPTLDA